MENQLLDKIKGCIYGHAIGDALGVGAEFFSKREVSKDYPGGLRNYDQFVPRVRRYWTPGGWTDDTEQMLCVMDSLIEKKRVDINDIAARFLFWFQNDGKGIGSTVLSVLKCSDFLQDPHSAAKRVWEGTHKTSAANGAIMRTSILGIWDFRQLEHVKNNAENVCKITHFDPRCAGSCVLVSLIISLILLGEKDVPFAIEHAAAVASEYDRRILEYVDISIKGTLGYLDLDEGLEPGERSTIGYTLKTMGAGLWALIHSEDFEDGLVQIINEGGDADTNAAVAGALLGARWGHSGIPERWKTGLLNRRRLDKDLKEFIALL